MRPQSCPGCGVVEGECHHIDCANLDPQERAAMLGDNTPEKTPGNGNLAEPWQPGQSGNPAGRPKGARNKLSEDFFKALMEDFADNGAAAIRLMRVERPGDYAKMVAALQTKEADINHSGDVIDALTHRIIDGRATD